MVGCLSVVKRGSSAAFHVFELLLSSSLSPLLKQCYRLPGCLFAGGRSWLGCRGLPAIGALEHLLSGDWLGTVEAPGHPRHPLSIQLDAVVKYYYYHYMLKF